MYTCTAARIVDWDDSALPPTQWPVAPAKGAKQMLDRFLAEKSLS